MSLSGSLSRNGTNLEEVLERAGSARSSRPLSVHQKRALRQMQDWSFLRIRAKRVVSNPAFDVGSMLIILVNICVIILETNAAARGEVAYWMKALNLFFMSVYCLEICLRLYVERAMYFTSSLNVLDFSLVSLDLLLQLLTISLISAVPTISVLRIFKTVRLVRAVRAFRGFRELWLMLHGFAAAMKAMIWATVLIGVVLLIWSVASVELLDHIVKELHEDGGFDPGCKRCGDAFSTVESSMLTWFAVIFAHDLWTELIIPMLCYKPVAALVVFPTYLCIQFGMLNLVLTVIVDRASEARKDDQEHIASEKKAGFGKVLRRLRVLCEAMDTDGNGHLTLEELQRGYDDYDEFGELLNSMDIGKEDIDTVFTILDQDRSGTVSYAEFVKELHKMRSLESHTLLVFIKHYVEEVRDKVTEQFDYLRGKVAPPDEALKSEPWRNESCAYEMASLASTRSRSKSLRTLPEDEESTYSLSADEGVESTRRELGARPCFPPPVIGEIESIVSARREVSTLPCFSSTEAPALDGEAQHNCQGDGEAGTSLHSPHFASSSEFRPPPEYRVQDASASASARSLGVERNSVPRPSSRDPSPRAALGVPDGGAFQRSSLEPSTPPEHGVLDASSSRDRVGAFALGADGGPVPGLGERTLSLGNTARL